MENYLYDLPDELVDYIFNIVHNIKFKESLDKINEENIRNIFVGKYIDLIISSVITRLEEENNV